MALAFDANSNSGAKSGTAYSWPHTSTGTGLILVVGASSSSVSLNGSVKSITYAGSNLTFIRSDLNDFSFTRTELWYLLNPPTGLGTISVTWNQTAGASWGGCGVTFTGGTTPIDANAGTQSSNSLSGTSNVLTGTVTSVASNCFFINMTCDNPVGALGTATPGAAQTVIGTIRDATIGVYHMASYMGAQTGAGTMSWTDNSSSPQIAMSLCTIQPATGGGGGGVTTAGWRMLSGVGN